MQKSRLILDNSEKTLTVPNVAMLIKSVFNSNQNHYYHNVFLEKNRINYKNIFLKFDKVEI